MKSICRILLLSTVILVALVGASIYWLQLYGVSARRKPLAVEAWIARHVRDLATPSYIRRLSNPIAATPLVLAEARDHFADHCATCHGNNGDGKTMLGGGMFPPPPDLASEETQRLSDGEIFNIIKEGIRFTGMPGFGGSDDDNWKLVLFVRHLPTLSVRERSLMEEVNGIQ